MRKKLSIVVISVCMLAATQANALSGACENLTGTVTNSYSQAYWYLACVADKLSTAWELFYNYF